MLRTTTVILENQVDKWNLKVELVYGKNEGYVVWELNYLKLST